MSTPIAKTEGYARVHFMDGGFVDLQLSEWDRVVAWWKLAKVGAGEPFIHSTDSWGGDIVMYGPDVCLIGKCTEENLERYEEYEDHHRRKDKARRMIDGDE